MEETITKDRLPDYYTMQDLRVLKLLRASRLSSGISQGELSKRIGCSQSLVCRIEKGGALSWLRYIPKINRWIAGCGGILTFGVKILQVTDVQSNKKGVNPGCLRVKPKKV